MRQRDKYPRTFHLACSPGVHRDDRQHANDALFNGREVIITEKMDGSGVSLHQDGLYARSKNGPPAHPSYHPLKALHATFAWQLEPHLSVFAEWCHTIHSVHYPKLPTKRELQLFAVRNDDTGMWWSWDDVTNLAKQLHVTTVPVLARRTITSERQLVDLVTDYVHNPSLYGPDREGVVVRTVDAFHNDTFTTSVAKWVRPNHVAGERWEKFGVRRHQTDG